jgi:phosphoglycerate kinase
MDLKNFPKIEDLELEGKRVLMRVDFNVPLNNGEITDDTRIRAALPSINHCLEHGARLILMSHLGRPKGVVNPSFSLEPAAVRLAEALETGEVMLTDSCIGDGAKRVVHDLRNGQVVVLENLRYNKGEIENDDTFARKLAAHGDVFIMEAFGACHRAHASTVGVTKYFKEKAAGLLVEKELQSLGGLLGEVKRPYIAILGGAKVSDKIDIIEDLLKRADTLIIGGAMANTFIAATGGEMANSLVEHNKLPLARNLLEKAKQQGVKLMIPLDMVVAEHPDATDTQVVPSAEIPAGQMALDIGPKSCSEFKDAIINAETVFWNGPMGMFEKDVFAEGTFAVARAIAGAAAFSAVGGGDSVAAVRKASLERGFDHVSTGGGASLKFLEGKDLPGIVALL